MVYGGKKGQRHSRRVRRRPVSRPVGCATRHRRPLECRRRCGRFSGPPPGVEGAGQAAGIAFGTAQRPPIASGLEPRACGLWGTGDRNRSGASGLIVLGGVLFLFTLACFAERSSKQLSAFCALVAFSHNGSSLVFGVGGILPGPGGCPVRRSAKLISLTESRLKFQDKSGEFAPGVRQRLP